MKVALFSTILLSGVLFFASCEQAPKSDDAKTSDAKKVDEGKAEGASELTLDTKASEVSWVGTKPVGKHNGTFAISEGKISVKDGQVTAGSFTIDMKSLKVVDLTDKDMNAKLAGHLTSADFFDAEKFATAKFEITNVAPFKKEDDAKEDKKDNTYAIANPTHSITGNLELKGVKKSVTFPAKITLSADKNEAEAKFNINRKDWGLNYNSEASLGDKFISHTVNIGLKLVATK